MFYTRSKLLLFYLLIVLGLFRASTINAQQIAFPGAEGSGMYTTGGRGTPSTPTTVFEVTNLSDDGLPGSLRYALTAPATYRTVVFRVSGTIHLNSKLSIKANTTIAGQTAPGDGICVADHPVSISGDHVIVRYMRFRMGDKNQKKLDANGNPVDGSGGDDAFGALGSNNLIIDHCSVSWSSDEALTIYRGDNLTIQWCMVSEPLNYSYHFETGDVDYEQHGYGGIWGAKRGTMHHNLIAHCRNRNPRFAGISTYSPNTVGVENVDFRNNVIYNWGINNVYGGDGGNYNVVNNYYKYGPNTSSGVRYRICNPSYGTSTPYGKWFVEGNYVDGSAAYTADNWSGGVVPQGGSADLATVRSYSAFELGYPVTTQSATDAYESVLQGSGCSLPNRDTLDQRIVNNVRNRTGRIIDVQGGYPHGTPYEQTVTAWPNLNATAAPVDSDHDGMPDSWETANGLNLNSSDDRGIVAANGFTNLENYLNSLTNPVVNTDPVIYANPSFSSFAQTTGAPSAVQTFIVSGAHLTGNITISAPANYQVSTDGINWSNSVSLTANEGAVSSTTISVRLNAAATGAYSGNIVASGGGAPTLSFAVNGTTSVPAPLVQSKPIGAFPDMDGGFENQTPGSYATVSSHTSTSKWEASSNFQILSSGARTGSKVMHWNGSSTSVKYLVSPVLTSPTLQAGTSYVVQFWYKKAASAGAGSLSLSGYNSIVGGMSGSTGTTTSQKDVVLHSTALSDWVVFRGVMTTQSGVTVTNTFGGVKVENPQSPFFDIDDYVIYPGNSFDVTAPDAVISPAANKSVDVNNIAVSWQAPASGFDGGGYVVVRSTSATAPVPNANGVYVAGNTMGSDNVVVYTGTATNFTDDGSVAALAASTTYYYHIFTADKAFNYSQAVSVQSTLNVSVPTVSLSGSISSFSQTVGTPSASKQFTVTGSNLSGNVQVTVPSGFELSDDDNTWSTSLSFVPSNNSVNETAFVRLNATEAGSYGGNISTSSNGATAATIAVSGATTAPVVIYTPANADAVVALDGSGQYTSIQAAINAAPTGRTTPYIIYITNGKYVEKVNIPSNKPFIHFIGESAANTIISWDSYSGKVENGVTIGTSTSATLTVNASDFFMMSVTVENASGYVGDGPQALALYVVGDRCAFKNCRFISGQDTVWHNGDGKRHYFKECYIDGNTDFIFGASTAAFDACIIYGRDRVDGNSGGYVTAANTPPGQTYGEVFRDCRIPNNRGVTSYSLGRPWQNDQGKESKTVFLNTVMGTSVMPAGWSVWNSTTNTSLITYAEYKSRKYNGDPVDVSQRVSWSKQLTDAEAAPYYVNSNLFGSWNPFTTFPALNGSATTELAVSNFRAQRGASNTTLSWNLSWPMSGVLYEVYRSTDNVNFTKINEVNGGSDEIVAFSVTDGVPAKGTIYYYYVKASKAGLASHNSYVAIVDPSVPLDGEFRTAGSGFWTNASSGNGTNATSIWEKYSASSKSWVLQGLGVQPSNVNVTIRAGHTVMIDGLKGVNSLYIENGAVLKSNGGYGATPGSQTLRIGAGSAASVIIQNDGVFGGDANPDDLITLEFNPACASVLWTGSGVSKITRLRPLPANPNALKVIFDQDVSLSYNSGSFTAYYNNSSNTVNENVTLTINPGKTVKLTHPSGSFSPTGTSTANPGGNYTYNINGTLDLSATTTTSNLVAYSTNASSVVSLNIGSGGTLKLGTGFNTVNSAPSASNNGKVLLTIADGGLVDATKTSNLNLGGNYFITSENGSLKRAVGTTAVTFPIGTSSSSYNPVVLTNSGTVDNFAVNVKNAFDHPVTDASKVVNKQWEISEDVEGGSNVTAKFGWQAADQASGFDLAQLLAVMKYAGSNWNITAATPGGSGTTADPYTATVSGISSFSSFGVTNYSKAGAAIHLEGGNFTYDGQSHAAAGFAYGTGGEADKLSPEVSFAYTDAKGQVLEGAPESAGTYSVTASFAGNSYYLPVSATATITIGQRPLTITAADQTMECGSVMELGTTAFIADGLVSGDAVNQVAFNSTGGGVGTYPIVPNNALGTGLSNYRITYVNGSLVVKDVTKPVITNIPTVPTQCYHTSGTYAIPQLTATDQCSAVNISYTISGATTRSGSGADASGSFGVGTSTINWVVDDGHGNESTAQTTIVVNAPLTVSIPDVYAMNPAVDEQNTIYLGYGPTLLHINTVAGGGTSPYTYLWNNGQTNQSISVSAAGTYTVTVKDAYQCVASTSIVINTLDVSCGKDNSKVKVCHNGKEICISSEDVQDHLAHGDRLGGCNAIASVVSSHNVGEESTAYQVKVYPNPVAHHININVSKLQAGASLQVYNASGAMVLSQRLTNSSYSIPAKGLKAGIYYVVVRNGERITTHKIVKQ
ncbi:pectinesterase family protein [Chitinophagaceae bacterium LB-8]|uniref:Pectinesterase family protein n=1 Tax=Paraflavisolibacter caeni TaxID=2982496 RepID=A0A9X2XSL3_9BACT|nr:pectinesterase family protein [Paraflavisolibacter caeni]MCU7547965.1 pectinesterase family protein [Paraflavisolibacter caeni]